MGDSQDSPIEIEAVTENVVFGCCCVLFPLSVCIVAVPVLGTVQSSRELLGISCSPWVRGRAERLHPEP